MKSLISDSFIDEVIFKTLRHENVQEGGWIHLDCIRQHWSLTGLRLGDLVEGLARLETRGMLRLEGADDNVYVILVERPVFSLEHSIRTMRMLKRAQLRARTESRSPALERRMPRAAFA